MGMRAKLNGSIKGYIDVSELPIVVEVIQQQGVPQKEKKTCPQCGNVVHVERATYCSKSCRQKAHYHRKKETERKQRNPIEKIREWIGEELIKLGKWFKGE